MTERIEIKDAKREAVIAHNLEMMNRPMLRLLTFESIGGNAGDAESDTGNSYPCVTANGYVDHDGNILIFGNIQNVPAEIVDKEKRFSIDVALDQGAGIKRIVSLEDREDLSPVVASILKESIDRFNKMYAKNKDDKQK